MTATVQERAGAAPLVDLDWLRTGLAVWITEAVNEHHNPTVDAFPSPPALQEVRERFGELVCEVCGPDGNLDSRLSVDLAKTAGRTAALESECWLNLGLLVGAHLALRRPLDPETLAGFAEEAERLAAAELGQR
jgi:hypothetical protein